MPITPADVARLKNQLDTDSSFPSLINVLKEVKRLVPPHRASGIYFMILDIQGEYDQATSDEARDKVTQDNIIYTKVFLDTYLSEGPPQPPASLTAPPPTGGKRRKQKNTLRRRRTTRRRKVTRRHRSTN